MGDLRTVEDTEYGAIIITGGSRGIGLATAQELVGLGFRKFILGYSTNEKDSEAAKALLETTDGVKVALVKGDVGEQSTIDAHFAAVHHEFEGSLYAIIHTAGAFLPLDTANPENTYNLYQEHYPKAFWRLVEKGVPYLEKSRHGGRIVVLSNPGVNLMSSPRPFYFLPGCGKASLEYMARHYALVLAPKKITCNVVIPGITDTIGWKNVRPPIDPVALARAKCPMKEILQPSDVGGAVAFLVSEKGRFITGAMLPVDGGLLFT